MRVVAQRACATSHRVDDGAGHASCILVDAMITDVTTLGLHASELASIQRSVAGYEQRAVLAVLQGALDQLNARLGGTFAADIESRIVDAAVLFDCVADVRALVPVLDRDLRDLATRLERFCDAMENGIAQELRAPAA